MAQNRRIPPVQCVWHSSWLPELRKYLQEYVDTHEKRNNPSDKQEAESAQKLIYKIDNYARIDESDEARLYLFENEAEDLIWILLTMLVMRDEHVKTLASIINLENSCLDLENGLLKNLLEKI